MKPASEDAVAMVTSMASKVTQKLAPVVRKKKNGGILP
jgi:hypothetical protein